MAFDVGREIEPHMARGFCGMPKSKREFHDDELCCYERSRAHRIRVHVCGERRSSKPCVDCDP